VLHDAEDARPGRGDPEDCACGHRLAASGLTHQSEDPAGIGVETGVFDECPGAAVSRVVFDAEVRDGEDRGRVAHVRSGSTFSWMPSAIRAKPTTVNARSTPGKTDCHHCPEVRNSDPDAIISPHSAVGGAGPRPRNPSPAARRTAYPTPMAA